MIATVLRSFGWNFDERSQGPRIEVNVKFFYPLIMQEVLHIYARVSTSSQEVDGTSLDTQIAMGEEYAYKNDMIPRVWNEGGKSSAGDSLENRPVLLEVLAKIDSGEINHLYVWNTDRLSRNLDAWTTIRMKLLQRDVVLHTPSGKQVLSDYQTNLVLGILKEISHYDNQLRTERFRLGKLNRVRQGGWMGGPPPFGYRIDDGKLVPDEEESNWVRNIYEWYLQGESIDFIRTRLLENGVTTRRGNPVWSHGAINKVLTNTHFAGFYNYTDKKTDETVRVECPTLISPLLVARVAEMREKRSYGKTGSLRSGSSNNKYVYLLAGLLRCGHCGGHLVGNRRKTQTSYYSCAQKTNKFKTKNTDRYVVCGAKRNLRIDKTDKVVWDAVIKVLSQSHLFKESVKTDLLQTRSFGESAHHLKKLRTQQSKLKKEIDQVTSAIVGHEASALIGSRDPEEVREILKTVEEYRLKLEAQYEQITQSLEDDSQQRAWVDWVKEFGNQINRLNHDSMSITDRKKFLQGVVSKITVSEKNLREHEIKIEFRFPYVDDYLEYPEVPQKGKRYRVRDGQKTKIFVENLLKK